MAVSPEVKKQPWQSAKVLGQEVARICSAGIATLFCIGDTFKQQIVLSMMVLKIVLWLRILMVVLRPVLMAVWVLATVSGFVCLMQLKWVTRPAGS
jgi:hypothetical protein